MSTKKAVAYLRTSSATNVGADKDSAKRQMAAINSYARVALFEIALPPYYDAAVSGADPIDPRPGFRELLTYLAQNPDVRTILVENASRFARDLAVQLTGHSLLKQRGIELIPVDAPNHFTDETPTATMVRQILGAVSEFEKASIVLKLRAARERKRATGAKVEGRKSHAERNPELVKLARKLYRKDRLTGKHMSLRDIAKELAAKGHLARSGKPYGPSAIRSMFANRKKAIQRTQDVAPLIAEARKAGHTSTRAIAAYLNGRKSTTPRGKQWTPTAVAAAMTFSQHFDADQPA